MRCWAQHLRPDSTVWPYHVYCIWPCQARKKILLCCTEYNWPMTWLNMMMSFLVNKPRLILGDTHLKCFMANIANLRHSCARLEMAWPLVAPLANVCSFLTIEQRVSPPRCWVGRTPPGHHIPGSWWSFCGVCPESTDRQEEFLDDVFHWDARRKGDSSCHDQVNSLGQRAGLGQVGLPSRLWQAKLALWLWSRHQSTVFKCTKAMLVLWGKHTMSKPNVVIPSLPLPVYLRRQFTFATIKQSWV